MRAPLFTGAVVGTFRRENLVSSAAVFVAYALGMTLVLLALTVSLGMAKQGLVRRLRQALPYVNRVSGALLVVAGLYLAHYGWYERRVRAGDGGDGSTRGRHRHRLVRRHRRLGQRRRAPTRLGLLLALGARRGPHRHLRAAGAPLTVGRFAELLAHDGVEEDLELRSPFGLMAFHGGNLEEGTDVIAAAVAEQAGASLYAVRQPVGLRWHLPSVEVGPADSPALAAFLDHVDVAVAIHGYGRDGMWTTLLLGGRNRDLAAHLGAPPARGDARRLRGGRRPRRRSPSSSGASTAPTP